MVDTGGNDRAEVKKGKRRDGGGQQRKNQTEDQSNKKYSKHGTEWEGETSVQREEKKTKHPLAKADPKKKKSVKRAKAGKKND